LEKELFLKYFEETKKISIYRRRNGIEGELWKQMSKSYLKKHLNLEDFHKTTNIPEKIRKLNNFDYEVLLERDFYNFIIENLDKEYFNKYMSNIKEVITIDFNYIKENIEDQFKVAMIENILEEEGLNIEVIPLLKSCKINIYSSEDIEKYIKIDETFIVEKPSLKELNEYVGNRVNSIIAKEKRNIFEYKQDKILRTTNGFVNIENTIKSILLKEGEEFKDILWNIIREKYNKQFSLRLNKRFNIGYTTLFNHNLEDKYKDMIINKTIKEYEELKDSIINYKIRDYMTPKQKEEKKEINYIIKEIEENIDIFEEQNDLLKIMKKSNDLFNTNYLYVKKTYLNKYFPNRELTGENITKYLKEVFNFNYLPSTNELEDKVTKEKETYKLIQDLSEYGLFNTMMLDVISFLYMGLNFNNKYYDKMVTLIVKKNRSRNYRYYVNLSIILTWFKKEDLIDKIDDYYDEYYDIDIQKIKRIMELEEKFDLIEKIEKNKVVEEIQEKEIIIETKKENK